MILLKLINFISFKSSEVKFKECKPTRMKVKLEIFFGHGLIIYMKHDVLYNYKKFSIYHFLGLL